MTTTNKHQEIFIAIENAFLKAEAVFGRKFIRCGIRVDIKSNSGKAGTAQVYPNRVIRINPFLYKQNPSHIINDTCPHEVAHVVAFDLYGKEGWGHGPRWKHVMRSIGQKPDRCHKLITTSFLNKPVYACNRCQKQVPVSRAAHNRVSSGTSKLRNCRCGGTYNFMGRGNELIKNNQLTCRELPENMGVRNQPVRSVASISGN